MPLDRADFRSAQICAVLANIHRKEDAEPFVAGDFIPQMAAAVEEEEEDLSEVDTEALSRQIQRVLGKKDV